jgi:hypothetical protein
LNKLGHKKGERNNMYSCTLNFWTVGLGCKKRTPQRERERERESERE